MDTPKYEVLEHTADLRMAFYGQDLEALLECAAYGLFREMAGLDLPPATSEAFEVELELDAADLLVRAWLAELLYLFDTEHILFTEWDVTITDEDELRATARGVPVPDLSQSPELDVKAVTYHGLEVIEVPEGLRAEVIFDL